MCEYYLYCLFYFKKWILINNLFFPVGHLFLSVYPLYMYLRGNCISNQNWACFVRFLSVYPLHMYLRGNCTSNQNWACFVCYLNITTTVLKNNISILKQIVWETPKWHYNFSRSSSSWVIYQNRQNISLMHNSRTAWPTKILMPFLSFLDNLLQVAYLIFQKVLIILR